MCSSDIFLGLIAILFPPIAVWVKRGLCSADSLINLALCCLGFLPGLLHAWYIIAKYPETDYDALAQDPEGGHVTHYYVDTRGHIAGPGRRQQRDYGTTTAAPMPASHGGEAVEGAVAGGVPPSYEQAVKGDHKIQTTH